MTVGGRRKKVKMPLSYLFLILELLTVKMLLNVHFAKQKPFSQALILLERDSLTI